MAFNAIGLGLTGLFLIPLAKQLFPPAYQAATSVRIAAGLTRSGEESQDTKGNCPSIALFDGDGHRIGFRRGEGHGIIGDGSFTDIKIDSIDRHDNRPAEYVSVSSGGTDALCVAYVYVTMANGDYWAFYGDVGYQCGAAWYHSNLLVGNQANIYYPKCVWIDSADPKSGHNNAFPQGMSIHIPDFLATEALAAQYQDQPATMCKSTPRFKMWPKLSELDCIPVFDPPLEYNKDSTDNDTTALFTDGKVHCDPGPGKDPSVQETHQLQQWSSGRFPAPQYGTKRKRTRTVRRDDPCMDGHVVISDLDAHSAREVCESDMSAGPDFVSTKEGLHCDMCTHELRDVCSAGVVKGCFDLATQTMRPGGGLQDRDEASGRIVPDKSYQKVTHWK